MKGYDGGWDELENWFDKEPEVDGRVTMSEYRRVFWRYWNEIPEAGRSYEEVEYDLQRLMLTHESINLWEDYEEANAKAKETVDGEEGFEADIEEEERGDEEEDAEDDDEPWEEDMTHSQMFGKVESG